MIFGDKHLDVLNGSGVGCSCGAQDYCNRCITRSIAPRHIRQRRSSLSHIQPADAHNLFGCRRAQILRLFSALHDCFERLEEIREGNGSGVRAVDQGVPVGAQRSNRKRHRDAVIAK
jgi:hypothetical protein